MVDYINTVAKKQGESPDDIFSRVLGDFFGKRLKSKIQVNKSNRELAGFSQQQIQLIQDGT